MPIDWSIQLGQRLLQRQPPAGNSTTLSISLKAATTLQTLLTAAAPWDDLAGISFDKSKNYLYISTIKI